jgi:hypothetical protein
MASPLLLRNEAKAGNAFVEALQALLVLYHSICQHVHKKGQARYTG